MAQTSQPIKAIILAAGKGSRLQTQTPKPLVTLGGRPMMGFVAETLKALGVEEVAVVVSPTPHGQAVQIYAQSLGFSTFTQQEPLGTAHAVLAATPFIQDPHAHYLVLCADTPLIQETDLRPLLEATKNADDTWAGTFLAMETSLPQGYGILTLDDKNQIQAITEASERVAGPNEHKVETCNTGICLLGGRHALSLLRAIPNDNSKGEYFLTTYPLQATAAGLRCTAVVSKTAEPFLGINTPNEYVYILQFLQARWRQRAMDQGALLLGAESTYFSYDTKLSPGVMVEPHVVFGPGVQVHQGAIVKAFSHLEGAVVGPCATVGPHARLRPGTHLGQKARVGNFVEVKKSYIEAGAKINHLSYIGDAHVAQGVNIGAGTITCNYDGVHKHKTIIEKDAFIGSNTSLVAPVTVGQGATIGAGSTITKDVPPEVLCLSRPPQEIVPSYISKRKAK